MLIIVLLENARVPSGRSNQWGDESVGKFRQADAVLSLSEDDIFVELQLNVRVISVEMKPRHPATSLTPISLILSAREL